MGKKLPLLLIFLVYCLGVFPDMLAFIPNLPDYIIDGLPIGGGLLAVDIVLVIMLLFVIYRFFNDEAKKIGVQNLGLIFFLYLMFSVARNISVYHISAFGEMRTRYFYLIIPCYIAYTFNTKELRDELKQMLVFVSLIIPFVLLPVIGELKGWYFGPADRFLNAQTYLGVIYGISYLYLGRKNIGRKKLIPFTVIAVILFTMLIIDSHRSVWMASFVIILLLYYYKEILILKNIYILIPVMIGIVFLLLFIQENNNIYMANVVQRGSAIISPFNDETSAWRLYVWQAQLENIFKHPFLGEGFGAYWYSYIPQIGAFTLSPHNFYIQSLVKIGIIGLALYILIYSKIFLKISKIIKTNICNEDRNILLLTLIVLISSHIFYSVYSLEYYSMFYIGLGFATLKSINND